MNDFSNKILSQLLSNDLISQILSRVSDENLVSIGDLYESKIAELKITKHQADQVLGLDKKTIDPILDYSAKGVDALNLIKLSKFLGIEDFTEFLKIYCAKLPVEKIRELEKVKKATFIVNHFNLDHLKRAGFIKGSINDFDEIEKRIITYFELDSLYDYDEELSVPLFSRTKRAKNGKMLDFWIRCAKYMFKKLNNPYPFDREFLKELVVKIKPFTTDEENGLIKVIRALYKAGVTVIFQSHVSTTQIRGATFIIDDKPCVVITDLNDRYPTVWFALLHELCHTLFDFDHIKSSGPHLSLDKGTDDIFLEEKMEEFANEFARDYFLNPSQLKYIAPHINDPFLVQRYAQNNSIHPSIIYSFYCWEQEYKNKKRLWGVFQDRFPSSKRLFNKINICLFDYDKLSDTTLPAKQILEPQIQ